MPIITLELNAILIGQAKHLFKMMIQKMNVLEKYKHVLESFHDHSEFLQKKRYAFLLSIKSLIIKLGAWAKKAGYAYEPTLSY